MNVKCRHDELKSLKELDAIRFPNNRNGHPAEQIIRLAEIMKYQGVRHPIVISKLSGLIVKGHGRLDAAIMNGWTEFPVEYQDYESEEQEYADNTADNAIALWAELDLKGIGEDVLEFGPDFDIDLLGIDGFVIDATEKFANQDADAIPENVETRCKTGDLWLLGEHRLLVGDCRKREAIKRLMNGQRAQLWASDPPYGIDHVNTSNQKEQSKGYKPIENDDLQFDELKDFLFAAIAPQIELAMADNFAFYMWHAMKMQSYAAAAAAAAAGILWHRQIIWVKPSLVFGMGQYHWRHELCLMGWLKGNKPPFYGERNQTTVWEMGRENDKIHPTQKPVEAYNRPILNHTKPGELIIDPFLGSGTALVSAEKLGRRCYGFEMEPTYADVIVARWEQLTGKTAVKADG